MFEDQQPADPTRMPDSDEHQVDPVALTKLLNQYSIPHNYEDPGSLQAIVLAAYHRKHPENGYLQQFQREVARSRQVLREIAIETLAGQDWQDQSTGITEKIALSVRYSGSASPENLKAAKEEVRRRRGTDPDFERRRKNAEHRAQERNAPVRLNVLKLDMARNWTNPNAPFWMAGVAGGAVWASQSMKENVDPVRFKTTRDRLDLRSFSKRPFIIIRRKNFETRDIQLTGETMTLIREWENEVNERIFQLAKTTYDLGAELIVEKTPGF